MPLFVPCGRVCFAGVTTRRRVSYVNKTHDDARHYLRAAAVEGPLRNRRAVFARVFFFFDYH